MGNLIGGAQRVKQHPFFGNLDWDELLHKQCRGPIIPPVRYTGDAQCFDTYAEDDGKGDAYSQSMAEKYDVFFRDF